MFQIFHTFFKGGDTRRWSVRPEVGAFPSSLFAFSSPLWYRIIQHEVGRFFPSTKLCSGCGYENDSVSLSDRAWICPECATHHLRDFNSAKHVKSEGLKIVDAGYRRR